MEYARSLSSGIDPSQYSRLNSMKEQALRIIDRALIWDRNLRDAAATAIRNEYDDMGADAFLKQLRTYCLILDALKKQDVFDQMLTLLVNLLRTGINKVDGEALDAVTVRRDALQVDIDGKSTLIGSVSPDLLTILSLGKESRETQRQLMAIEKLVERRSDENLEAVSSYFRMPIHDTEKITLLVHTLFDSQGNFIRTAFEPMLDELARHGNHAFELLWCYFKVLEGRTNRIAFLNALQHLIDRIERPKHALRFLLADFCRQPDKVAPTDRNSIMLANILLRTYNKELDVDIEMTPEEVLNVRNGLDKDMVRYAQFRIDSVEYRFAAKIYAIHGQMVALLNTAPSDKQALPVRHLLFLERELLIFLSLLSGKTAHYILIWALTEYGDPQAGIHRHLAASTYLPVFLQHLKIIVRGVGRVGSHEDVDLLRRISKYGPQLSKIKGPPENKRSVARTMQLIEDIIDRKCNSRS